VPREIALGLAGSKVDVDASEKTKTSSPHPEWNYTHRRLTAIAEQSAPSEVQFDNTTRHNRLRQDSNITGHM